MNLNSINPPSRCRVDIAMLMADGRERTVEDIAQSTGRTKPPVQKDLRIMAKMGLIYSTYVEGVAVYRKATK